MQHKENYYKLLAHIFYLVATISFSQSSFDVVENEAVIVIDLVRSGDTTSEVVVLIGNLPHQGSATGLFRVSRVYVELM